MQANDVGEFRQFLESALGFWRVDVSEFSLSVWWEAMRPYDLAAVRQAFSRHAMNPDGGQFAPKPADVVKMLAGTSNDRALLAWAKVDKAVRSVGSYQTVAFDDLLIHRVLQDMGGWIVLGTKTEDDWPFVANEFENRYRGYAMRGEKPEYPHVLIGMAEAQNTQAGFKSQPPVLIGDAEKAKRVMLGGSVKPMIGFQQMDTHEAEQTLRLVHKRDAA